MKFIMAILILTFAVFAQNNPANLVHIEESSVIDTANNNTVVQQLYRYIDTAKTVCGINVCETYDVVLILNVPDSSYVLVTSTVIFHLKDSLYSVIQAAVFDIDSEGHQLKQIGLFGSLDQPVVEWTHVRNTPYKKELQFIKKNKSKFLRKK